MQYLVSNSIRKADGWSVRFVINPCDQVPGIPVQPLRGTLEMPIYALLHLQRTEERMETDYAITSIFHIARADFLQRIRSYYFLIALGVCVFIIYSFVPPVDAGYRMVSLGNYRGFYNSAWIGSMVAMCVPFFALIGFYVVNNAVQRDIDTGVGQIIATTCITKVQYLTGKMISNFTVLLLTADCRLPTADRGHDSRHVPEPGSFP